MLVVRELNSWSDFENIVQNDLIKETQEMRYTSLYRGHPDSSWKLETTLERYMGQNQTVDSYYLNISSLRARLETFTDKHWDLDDTRDPRIELADHEPVISKSIINYMQYLRHFGYPSPLLDWTSSPFIAAYFAFRDISNKAKSVAIYALLETSDIFGGNLSKSQISENAQINIVGTSSTNNKRHYLQQSSYTICLRRSGNKVYYASHEDPYVVGVGSDDSPYGEAITKYIIPASERITALQKLDAYNINAYSLIGTEESLLETLFIRGYKANEIQKRIYPDLDI